MATIYRRCRPRFFVFDGSGQSGARRRQLWLGNHVMAEIDLKATAHVRQSQLGSPGLGVEAA